jgi:hypothetical protein
VARFGHFLPLDKGSFPARSNRSGTVNRKGRWRTLVNGRVKGIVIRGRRNLYLQEIEDKGGRGEIRDCP